jgi:NADH-quinone oxidoreductase subunit M
MWPVHTWLPDAHVEAPTAGSVILAGVLLKMGGYGFIRFSVPLLPEATQYFAPLIFGLSCVAVIYTSLVALVQEDMKKLIAYSSVAHMGFVTIGIFVMNMQAVQGSIFQMLSHGIVSAALFLCVGVVYDRMHTREIDAYGGLVHRMPRYAFVFMFFTLASVGLPGLSGFVGEFLVLIGTFKANTWVAFLAATGLILGAAYALWLYRKIIFGQLTKDSLKAITDMNTREVAVFLPLVLITSVDGHLSQLLPRPMAPAVDKLIGDYNAALKLARTAALHEHGHVIGLEHWSLARPSSSSPRDGAAAAVRRAARRGSRPPSVSLATCRAAGRRRCCCSCPIREGTAFANLFITDRLTDHDKALVLSSSAVAILMSRAYFERGRPGASSIR